MVRCMYKGIILKSCEQGWAFSDDTYQYSSQDVDDDILAVNFSEGEDDLIIVSPNNVFNYESPSKMEAAGHVTKIIEANEHGRPRLKIIYQDVDEWTTEVLKLKLYQAKIIRQAELDSVKKLNAEAKSGETLEPPRLIFVLQYKDFWPGSEMNPEAMRRRLSKQKQSQVSTSKAGQKIIFVYDKIVKSDGDFDYAGTLDERYFDPNQPGGRFILECLKERSKAMMLGKKRRKKTTFDESITKNLGSKSSSENVFGRHSDNEVRRLQGASAVQECEQGDSKKPRLKKLAQLGLLIAPTLDKVSHDIFTFNAKNTVELYPEKNVREEALANLGLEFDIGKISTQATARDLKKAKERKATLAARLGKITVGPSNKFKKSLSNASASEKSMIDFLSKCETIVQNLEAKVEKEKISQAKMLDLLISRSKQLAKSKILLQKCKLEAASLHKKVERLESLVGQANRDSRLLHLPLKKASINNALIKETFETLQYELQEAKEAQLHSRMGEKSASLEPYGLLKEKDTLEQLNLAIDLKEKDKMAMDELVKALEEVLVGSSSLKKHGSI